MGFFNFLKKGKKPTTEPAEKVEVISRVEPLGPHLDRLPKIKALGGDLREDALQNLLRILCYDARGEIAIHASIAIACRAEPKAVKTAIAAMYNDNDVPGAAGPGFPPHSGNSIFPRMRLLYPLAWMGDGGLIRKLLDGSSSGWEGAMKGKKACYTLIDSVEQGHAAIAERLSFFEYIDEDGNREMMEQACELYPAANLSKIIWQVVKGRVSR